MIKFAENFFIREIIEKANNEEEQKSNSSAEVPYNENSSENQKMSRSFYTKEGLDFLYFQRPGTAYNNPAAFGKTSESKIMSMMGTATR